MKKKIAVLLICLMILSSVPLEQFISFAGASDFKPDLVHTREWFEQGNTEAQNKIEEAESYLNALGVRKYNEKSQILDVITFAMYGVAVYGFPHGDKKTPNQFDELAREEYRFLGYDIQGNDVTNTCFPEDATSDNQDLLSKDWRTQPNNFKTWDKVKNQDSLIEYIFTTHGLTYDGEEIPYNLSEIIGTTNISTLKTYINLQTIPKFAVWGSVRLYSMGGDGVLRYRTFLIPPLAGNKTVEAHIEADDCIMERGEQYIDIPVTVWGEISTEDNFLETYIAEKWTVFDNVQRTGESNTYTHRIYKSQLEEGDNPVTLTGIAGIKSGFANDSAITDEASTQITVTVMGEEDNLMARLNLPKSAGVNEEYTVKDVSYIPEDAEILSSTLTKKVGSAREEEVESWTNNTKSIEDTSPVMGIITYTLTLVLTDGQVDSDTKSIEITDARNVDATADLELDPYTYEGHPAYAHDASEFDVDGEWYSAKRAYEENLARNSFDVVENTEYTLKRLDDTTARIVFEHAGWYNVELEVKTKNNEKLYDMESIEVRPTPYIEAFIGGTQKENRKQILSMSAGIHPDYPITNFWVEIEDTDTGEKVHLTNLKKNSDHIKTRDIISNTSEYFHNYTLEFLTKNDTEKVYKYTVYVKDSKGDTDTVSEYFTVYPDLPPIAEITLSDSFLRNHNSNIADITVEDMTISSDGDQVERNWSIQRDLNNNGIFEDTEPLEDMALFNMQDLSFGSKQKVSFEKEGVGKVNVRLDVKEVWVEPTLEEYVTDADRLTGHISAVTEVKNVAPMVSVEPVITHPLDILLLTSQNNYESVKNNLITLETLFKESAIDAKINLQALDNKAEMSNGPLFTKSAQVQSRGFNTHMILMDNIHLYRVIPSGLDSGYKAILPYKIEALNAETGNIVWSYAMGDEVDFRINQDHEQKYLYVIKENGTTLLINKSTGAMVGTLDFEVDGSIYTTEDSIFMFNDASIKKYSIPSGTLTTVLEEGNSTTYMENGRVCFVSVDKYNQTYRGKYNLDTGEYKREYIELIGRDKEYYNMFPSVSHPTNAYFSKYIIVDIDNYGTALTRQEIFYPNIAGGTVARTGRNLYYVVSPDNRIIKTAVGDVGSRQTIYDPNDGLIRNSKGKAEHFFYGISEGEKDKVHTYVYEIYGDRVTSYSDDAERQNKPLFGINTGEYLYVFVGADKRYRVNKRGHVFSVRLSDFNTKKESSLSSLHDWDEEAKLSDLYAGTVYDIQDDSYSENRSYVKTFRFEQTLDDILERFVHRFFVNSNEESQKYVAVLDDTFYTDETLPQGVIDELKRSGAKFIYVGDNSNQNNYGNKIISAVGGEKIEYTDNVDLNFTRIANLLESLLDKIKNSVKLSITNSDTIRLRKSINLDPSSKYEYEYDIKYSKDFSSKDKNILSLSTSASDVPNYGLNLQNPSSSNIQSYGYLEDVLYEDFNGQYVNPKLEIIEGDAKIEESTSFLGSGKLTSRRTHKGNIKFNMEKNGFVSFDIIGALTGQNDSYISVTDNGKEVFRYDMADNSPATYNRIDPYTNVVTYCEAGEHNFEVKIYCYTAGMGMWAGLDNFRIRYINHLGSNTRDTGTSPDPKISSIKKDTWYGVKNDLTTPSEACKIVNIPGGRTAIENWQDGAVQPIISGLRWLGISNGVAKTPDDYSYRSSEIDFTVPENHVVNVQFEISIDATNGNAPLYTYYVGTHGDYKIKTGRTTTTINMDLHSGTHTFGAYLRYERNDKWRYGKATFSNIIIKDKGMETDSGDNYFIVQQSDDTATLDLLVNGSDYNAQISDFKLYKIINGRKYSVLEEDFISQDHFEEDWAIVKNQSNSSVNLVEESISTEDEAAPLIYKKGQLILYNIYYDDYENDPSKKQYWQYTHTPWADGLHPDAGKILNEPIDRFYIDGKYTVKHWQEDSTGVNSYDKLSNVEEITFYIEGTAIAPEVTYIKTIPGEVKEGDDYRIEIGVWDEDLDTLDTTIELFKNNRLIYTYKKDGVAPVNSEYSPIISGYAPTATPGKYTVVATASDRTATGVRSYTFTVVSEGRIEGMVNHTEQWDINRKKYNLSKTGTEDSPRGYNVFWSGEKFVLQGSAEGNPISVHVQILGNPYSTYLSSYDEGATWNGDLWDESMINRWGCTTPETLTFRFTANFNGGIVRTDDVQIIIDNTYPYWRYHQKW